MYKRQDNLEITNTSFFYYKKELVLIEESYLYNNIPCTLYIMNNNTIIRGVGLDLICTSIMNYNGIKILYDYFEPNLYFKINKDLTYQFIINSSNLDLIEEVVSHLTQI